MNFQNRKYYCYAILSTEDELIFAKHKEHHRTNKQEWYIYANYLNNIAVQCGMETNLGPFSVSLVSV